jgi:RNA-binding protein YlmH
VELPETILGFTLRALLDEEIESLPACTQTGSSTTTTASARIDAVSAAVLKPSREQVKRHLESGGVLLNYQPVGKSGKELAPGDVVAVRNAGRYRLEELMGETKKGRVRIKAEILNGS